MLSRVADSLYWMSRYFERSDHCARVLDANYNLMLNPSKVSTEQRWQRIMAALGLDSSSDIIDPQTIIAKLTFDTENKASIISCLTGARENASQVREQISSEMWERLNQLYHEVNQSKLKFEGDPLRIAPVIREGSYRFNGVTDATMSHGEGWHFIQLGKHMERACDLSVLLDAHFSSAVGADDLDWVGLLTSCSAFEAYCKVYTADLNPKRVAEFLILNAEFPYSVRHAAERMNRALDAISEASSAHKAARMDRIIGKLRSSLAYSQIDDIMTRDLHSYLHGVIEQCRSLHAAVHDAYIDYPIEAALEA
jgi:uncharacterized alpha-E superfamily protein